MPDRFAATADLVVIDRLVLDIPGMDTAQARTIAHDLGVRLAAAGLSGEHGAVTVDLDGDDDIAARIADALKQRLL